MLEWQSPYGPNLAGLGHAVEWLFVFRIAWLPECALAYFPLLSLDITQQFPDFRVTAGILAKFCCRTRSTRHLWTPMKQPERWRHGPPVFVTHVYRSFCPAQNQNPVKTYPHTYKGHQPSALLHLGCAFFQVSICPFRLDQYLVVFGHTPFIRPPTRC